MPPAALISSAASWAACGIDEPATACASAMTPILIGSEVCAETLKGASARVKTAHPSSHGRAARLVLFMSFLPFLSQKYGAAALRGAYQEFAAKVIGMSAGLQTSGTTWNSHSPAFPPKPRRVTWCLPAAQMLYPGNGHALCRRGCSSMVEQKPSKLMTRVRFPSPAPTFALWSLRLAGQPRPRRLPAVAAVKAGWALAPFCGKGMRTRAVGV